MIQQGKKYLITTDAFFYGSDGEQYRAAYGVCEIITAEQAFGFVPQRPSTNWFVKVGTGEKFVIIAGCQIHYAVRMEKRPYKSKETYLTSEKVLRNVNDIFFT